MKLICFAYRIVGLSCLVLAVFVDSAMAGSTALCEASSCANKWCGSPGVGPGATACWVKVTEATESNGSRVTKTYPDTVCVHPDTEISWYTLEPNSEFTVTFATHPFPNTPSGTFTGKKGQPSGDTAQGSSACYQYSVVHCISTGNCAKADPKVIVDSGRGLKKH
jgi:hypothetical protein